MAYKIKTWREKALEKAAKVDPKLVWAMENCDFSDSCLPQMIKALQMFSWSNTEEENTRLAAAQYYQRNKHKLNRKAA